MLDEEKLKNKAEILLNAIKGKQYLKETKEYTELCSNLSIVYEMAININDISLKNSALDALISMCRDLTKCLNSYSEVLDQTIDLLVEMSGTIIDNE